MGALFFVVGFYMLPWIIAAVRVHHQSLAIFALNLFLGWTALGWIVALIWALTAVRRELAAPAPDAERVEPRISPPADHQ
jgi:ABC-type transport system involved in cytochrome c biogenesis permease component